MARFPDGPWSIDPNLTQYNGAPDSECEQEDLNAVFINRPGHGEFAKVVICTGGSSPNIDGECMRYAQLIARTPDLLASLKELTVVLERQGINDDNRKAYLKAAMILETFGV